MYDQHNLRECKAHQSVGGSSIALPSAEALSINTCAILVCQTSHHLDRKTSNKDAHLYEIDLSNKISSALCIRDHVLKQIPDQIKRQGMLLSKADGLCTYCLASSGAVATSSPEDHYREVSGNGACPKGTGGAQDLPFAQPDTARLKFAMWDLDHDDPDIRGHRLICTSNCYSVKAQRKGATSQQCADR